MSEVKTKQAIEQLTHIIDTGMTVRQILIQAISTINFGSETLQYSQEMKQKIIAYYEQKKAELIEMVNNLP